MGGCASRRDKSRRSFGLIAALGAAFFVLAAASSVAFAGPSVPTTSGAWQAFYSTENPLISLEEATVQATVYVAFAEYRVDLRFVNAGAGQVVRLGFPYFESVPFGLRLYSNGKPVGVYRGRVGRPRGYVDDLMFDVDFPSGETMLTMAFCAQPASTDVNGQYYEFLVYGGAFWAGTVDRLVVRFRPAADFLGTVREANDAELWHGADFAAKIIPFRMTGDDSYELAFRELEPQGSDGPVFAFTQPGPRKTTVLVGSTPSTEDADGAGLATHAIDGDLGTGWAFRPGEPTWIEVRTRDGGSAREIGILPGKSPEPGVFANYGRPRSVRITLPDGASTLATLDDEPALQRFTLPGRSDRVRLEVLDTYPGKYVDLAYIAELQLCSQPSPAFETFARLIGAQTVDANPEYFAGPLVSFYISSAVVSTPTGLPAPIAQVAGYSATREAPEFSDGPGIPAAVLAIPFVIIGLIVGIPILLVGVRVVSLITRRRGD